MEIIPYDHSSEMMPEVNIRFLVLGNFKNSFKIKSKHKLSFKFKTHFSVISAFSSKLNSDVLRDPPLVSNYHFQ